MVARTTEQQQREAFSARLREALSDLGMGTAAAKKQWLKRHGGVGREGARKWLSGKGFPKQARWQPLADGLGVRTEWLRDGIPPKDPTHIAEPRTVYGYSAKPPPRPIKTRRDNLPDVLKQIIDSYHNGQLCPEDIELMGRIVDRLTGRT